jgi:hypothetical protein
MSWSIYVNGKTPEAAKRYVEALPEPTEKSWGPPRAAKDLVLAAIELAGVTMPGVGLKIEASGHSPDGNCRVNVEPFTFVE